MDTAEDFHTMVLVDGLDTTTALSMLITTTTTTTATTAATMATTATTTTTAPTATTTTAAMTATRNCFRRGKTYRGWLCLIAQLIRLRGCFAIAVVASH